MLGSFASDGDDTRVSVQLKREERRFSGKYGFDANVRH